MAAKPGWLPAATGALTMGLAVWVSVTVAQPEEPPEPPPVPEVTTSVAPAPTSSVEPVVVTTPPPDMEGLSEAVARVLSTSGFASELTEQDIASQLPATVYRTLVDNGVVLTIATQESGQ